MNYDQIYDENGAIRPEITSKRGIKKYIRSCPWLLEFAARELQNNFILVKQAVMRDGLALKYASQKLKKNKKIVSLAIKDSEYAFLYADESLQEDDGFCLSALKLNPSIYPLLSWRLRASTRIIARAIRWKATNALDIPADYRYKPLQVKRFILLNSSVARYLKKIESLTNVKNSLQEKNYQPISSHQQFCDFTNSKNSSLKLHSKIIRSNADCVLKAMKKSPFEIRYAEKSLLCNHHFVYQACKIYPDSFSYAHKSLKNDGEFVTKLMQLSPSVLKFADPELLNDKSLALKLVKENGSNIRCLSHSLKHDFDIIRCAVKSEPLAIRYVKYWLTDLNLIKSAISKNAFSVMHAEITDIDEEDLEEIACTVVNNFPNDITTITKSYDLIFEKYQDQLDLETKRLILIKETIDRKFSNLNFSVPFALHVFHNFKKLKSYYDWYSFFHELAQENTIIAKIFIKNGFIADDYPISFSEKMDQNKSLIKKHCPKSISEFSTLGSLRKAIINNYAEFITNDIFELTMIKERFENEGVIMPSHFKAMSDYIHSN